MAKQDYRKLAKQLAKNIHEESLRLGNVLVAISDAGLHYQWGFSRWDDYCEEEIGMSKDTAYHLMRLSRWVRTMGLTVAQRTRFGRLGRYKALLMTRVCTTKGKINFWLKVAENNSLKHMRAEVAGMDEAEMPATWGFWISNPQKLTVEEALTLASETSDETTKAALLVKVCEDYLKRHKKSRKGKTALA